MNVVAIASRTDNPQIISEIPKQNQEDVSWRAIALFQCRVANWLEEMRLKYFEEAALPELPHSFTQEVAAAYVEGNTPPKRQPAYKPYASREAAQATFDAVSWELRTQGIAALKEERTRRRLECLTPQQRRELAAALDKLRGKFPAITDALIMQVSGGVR